MSKSYWSEVLNQRIGRRRAIAGAAGVGAAAAFLAACGGGSGQSNGANSTGSGLLSSPADTSKQAKRGGTSKFYITADPQTFDLHQAIAPLEVPQGHVYSRLTQEKAGHLGAPTFDIIPDLAESWEWSPDRLQLTMKIRQGVKWHNKAPVNARPFDVEDVLFSWDRFSKTASDRGSLANVANPDAPVLSVTSPDKSTVVFKLKYPLVYLTAILGNYLSGHVTMIPKETDSTFQIKGDMIGTGPFSLSNYTPSVGFTFKRNPDYYEKDFPLIDTVEMPIVLDYSQGLAQLKAGNVYTYAVRPDDIVLTKKDTPDLQMFQTFNYQQDLASAIKTVFGWQPAGKSAFNDERVRQAMSMSYDRDLFIDTVYNVSKFQSQGLPVATRWHSHLALMFDGWWLDPRGKDFGPNAKYFQYDIAEAKKLLSAAGYPNGLEVQAHVNSTGYGPDHPKQVEIVQGMAKDAGFKFTTILADYVSEFIPKYRDGKGNFEGVSYKAGAVSGNDPVAHLAFEYYSKIGSNFFGFDANGKGDNSGDPYIDSRIESARGETDTEKRRALVQDIQRYLGQKMYGIRWPGATTGFLLAWPALANFNVFIGDQRQGDYTWWIDETKAPLKKA